MSAVFVPRDADDRSSSIAQLRQSFERMRRAHAAEPAPSLALRLDRLARIRAMTDQFAREIRAAISADFGHRPSQVTEIADLIAVRNAVSHARRHLAGWTRTRRVATPWSLRPGRSIVTPQPLGVVGIVAPWNYPYQLSIGPTVSALAAGNRALVKPSDRTPRFAALLRQAVERWFLPDELAVTTGDAAFARAFCAMPFDHLLFTGSEATGREVALAAAANHVPVTLELGGKSPAIVDADCDLDEAAPRLMAAKLFNAGQTCVAPDYVLVHESMTDRLLDALRGATARLFPTIAGNADYCALVDERHAARLRHLVDDATARGAVVVPLHAETIARDRRMPPLALIDVDDRMTVMNEEVFGPLLPIVRYRDLDEAVAHVNARPRPLALYWFGRSRNDRDAVLARTVSGGVTINDCLFHVVHEGLPFGGVGGSGHGRHHGEHGFRTFSHDKPVFIQSRWTPTGMMAPPYGPTFARIARWLGARD